MRCRACHSLLEPHAFPGGVVRCACGADNETPHPRAPPATHVPYRDPAPPAPEPPPPAAPTVARSHGIGPLCPRCTRLLHDDAERAALACDACLGLFVDHAILAAWVDAARPVDASGPVVRPSSFSRRGGDVRYGRCPHCGQVMTRMIFGQRSGIVVDVCREHGTWLDHGELDYVLVFVRSGGLQRDRPPAAPPAVDRAPEAELTVALLGETQREVQHGSDLADLLLRSGHLWRELLR